MKLTEALKLLQGTSPQNQPYEVLLACGFTPLHLETFLGAHLQRRLTDRCVKIRKGLYGDVAGTLETGSVFAVALALEWSDLDARLGYRSAGAWNSTVDIVSSVRMMLHRIEDAISRVSAGVSVAISLPTLSLPPLFHPAGWQISMAELELEKLLLEFASSVATRRGCGIVHPGRIGRLSPLEGRYDFKSDLNTGLPYTLAHADVMGDTLAQLLAPPPPKKGLITDLDDTLWFGIVGEVGPQNVCWDLASHRQLHGLYQKLLSTLASEGVLVGVASKNDPEIAGQALRRDDILIQNQKMFPLEISWNAKSGAVKRILGTWNIGADSVVFVDDSPMELAEVKSAHPGIECVLFPKDDLKAGYEMLGHLRDWFGKTRLSEEDALRLESIRQGASFRATEGGSASEEFLEQANAMVTFDFETVAADPRALDLVNKTNQFNLNGRRISESDWQGRLARKESIAATVSYQDRFGPLGKIGVLGGHKTGDSVELDTWVMSCRAFARRIEHQCIKALFERYDAAAIRFAFQPTAKNSPIGEMLAGFVDNLTEEPLSISREQFEERCPKLYHQVAGLERVSTIF